MSSRARPRMRPLTASLRLLSVVLATALSSGGPAIPAQAGSVTHCLVGFDGFQPPATVTDPYYFAPEGNSVAVQVARRDSDVCSLDPNTSVQYRTVNGTAAAPDDFTEQDATIELSGGVGTDFIPLADDLEVEPVVERFEIQIYGTEQGWLMGGPNPVPAYVIDLDGSTRVAFRQATLVQNETRTSVRIPVFMAGPIGGDVAVGFTVQPGPTNPATGGDDYLPPSGNTLQFSSSNRAQPIQFSIINDSDIEDAETIQVSLEAGAGYALASPSTLILTIQDNDRDFISPTSWFHHPRQGKLYPYGDYRLREMHVFFDDQGSPPSGVVAAEMALRKKKLDGSCTWWYKGRWAAGSCSSKRWLSMEFDFDLYLRRFPALRPSVGTRIKNYTAWCRATDGAGNVQAEFVKSFKRGSWNTFEVAKP